MINTGTFVKLVLRLMSVAYIVFRAFTVLVILPMSTPIASWSFLYFLGILLLAVVAAIFSFIGKKIPAAMFSVAVALISVIYWWFVVCRQSIPIWSDFDWLVVPELCFAVAVSGLAALDARGTIP